MVFIAISRGHPCAAPPKRRRVAAPTKIASVDWRQKSDYARASLFFHAIVKRRGIAGLKEIYDLMAGKNFSLQQAVQAKLHWNQEKLEEEAKRVVELK